MTIIIMMIPVTTSTMGRLFLLVAISLGSPGRETRTKVPPLPFEMIRSL